MCERELRLDDALVIYPKVKPSMPMAMSAAKVLTAVVLGSPITADTCSKAVHPHLIGICQGGTR